MDSSLTDLSFRLLKKFDFFLPSIFDNRALFWNEIKIKMGLYLTSPYIRTSTLSTFIISS